MRRNTAIGIATVAILVGAGVAFVVWAIVPVMTPAPSISSTKILDRNGGLLYEIAKADEGVRTAVAYDQLPPSFVHALVASEDVRFYQHHGIDWPSVIRVIWNLAREGKVIGGASTLEQQTVKNLYFPDAPRTFIQKLREMVAAEYWSFTHTKQQTVETYANTVFFGNQANGIQAAAQTYFHKNVQDLTLGESAMLVGMIPAPSQYDPYRHWSLARGRERLVLGRMVADTSLTQAESDAAYASAIDVFAPTHGITAPHFVFHVLDELEARYPDIREGGYTVRTTLDPDLQALAGETVSRRLLTLAQQNVTDAAVVAMSPQTGEILAYVGSENFFNQRIQGQVDMAEAKRQPGSSLKPFLYMQSFLEGFTPATVIADLPVRFEAADGSPYYPRNYGYKYHGPVSIRQALGSSLNIPAVKVLDQVGLSTFAGVLSKFGIRFPEPVDHYGLGLVLGGGEVSLLDATHAYAELALYGKSVSPIDVLEVREANGTVIEQNKPAEHRPLLDDPNAPTAAWLISDILSDRLARSLSFGEASLLEVGKRVAVKTGTTKDFRDNWAFGYTPDFTLGVWVGNADNQPMEGVSGITGAVPIWHDIMVRRLASQPTVAWPDVRGVVSLDVCATSGLLANGICPKTNNEKFIQGHVPTEADHWYVRLDIDAPTGLLAADACRSHVIQKTFLQPPPEYAAWFANTGSETAPTKDCTGKPADTAPSPLTILSPLDGDAFQRDLLMDPAGVAIPFMAGGQGRSSYVWNLNGKRLESAGPTYLWTPLPGSYTLELQGADRAIHFNVQ